MSVNRESNPANALPINRVARLLLRRAKAESSPDYPYLMQLGQWGIETLQPVLPKTGPSRQDVTDFLNRLTWPGRDPMKTTKLLEGQGNLRPTEMLRASPEDAAVMVIQRVAELLSEQLP